MTAPTRQQIQDDPRVLQSYLAAALDIEVDGAAAKDGFAMKLGTLKAVFLMRAAEVVELHPLEERPSRLDRGRQATRLDARAAHKSEVWTQ